MNLQSFFSFCGIDYGASRNHVIRLLGQPDRANEFSSAKMAEYYYFEGALTVMYSMDTGRVSSLMVSNALVINDLKCKAGIEDEKLKFLGKNVNDILAAFGKPIDSSNNSYDYLVGDGKGRNMEVNFPCTENNECYSIEVTFHYEL